MIIYIKCVYVETLCPYFFGFKNDFYRLYYGFFVLYIIYYIHKRVFLWRGIMVCF